MQMLKNNSKNLKSYRISSTVQRPFYDDKSRIFAFHTIEVIMSVFSVFHQNYTIQILSKDEYQVLENYLVDLRS